MRSFSSQKRYQVRKPHGEQQEFRVRLPKPGEIFGKVMQLHGSKHMTVKCADGKLRMCRIPGKLRKIWVREGDYALVEPWSIEADKKGDITWRYKQVEIDWLKKNGHLPDL
jgi:translation initiation factor 1A